MKTDFSILMLVLWLCIGVIYLLVAVLQLFYRVRRLERRERPAAGAKISRLLIPKPEPPPPLPPPCRGEDQKLRETPPLASSG